MKKFLLVAGVFLLSMGANAQVGINAGEQPEGTLQVGYTSDWAANKPQAVSFPNVSTAVRSRWRDVKEGMMIYNTTRHCLEVFNGTGWLCVQGRGEKDFEYNGRWYNGSYYVKDLKFGDGQHDFIYKIITGPDGKKWLNNNLGADYANVHSDVFNPDQQATSFNDYHAYGSLFQWGRVDDTGYELINWTSSTSGTPVKSNAGWMTNSQLPNYDNDPCPDGWHTPYKSELVALRKRLNYIDENGASSTLRLPSAPYRRENVFTKAETGFYWTRIPKDDDYAWVAWFLREDSGIIYIERTLGCSVRCLKD